MTRQVRLRSLAKVNLDLRVLHKRADGFHELRTVFQTISLPDTISIAFEPARRTALEIDDPLGIPDNLVLRAARAVLDVMKTHARLRFRLQKRIPMGGGFGGGSSNAAAILLALPVLAGRRIPLARLLDMAAELGSDVPFFLMGGTAVAVGRGTEFYALPDVATEHMLVVAPGIHVATGPAYAALGRSLTSPDLSRRINDFQLFVQTLGDLDSARAASTFSANDFESAVFSQQPLLEKMWRRLRRFESGARMTGSGSGLFAVFGSKAERDLAVSTLEGDRLFEHCRVIPATLVSGSRYRRMWRRQLSEFIDEPRTQNDTLWPPHSRHAA